MVNSIDRDQELVEGIERSLGQVLEGYRQMLDAFEAAPGDEDLKALIIADKEREMAEMRERADRIIAWTQER
jgi:hypothetical protein